MNAPLTLKTTPTIDCSPEEWEARVDLACLYRIVSHLGWHKSIIYNHISMRVPGEPDAFLINAYGLLYEEITASSLIKIDHEGNVLAKPDFGELNYGVNRAGFVIHSAIHMSSPDLNWVIHTHSRAGVAVSALKDGLIPVNQGGFQFHNRIAYHDYEGFALDAEERLFWAVLLSVAISAAVVVTLAVVDRYTFERLLLAAAKRHPSAR